MTTPTNDRALQPVKEVRDVVSLEEFAQRESFGPSEREFQPDDEFREGEWRLLDPILAQERESARFRSAPRRRRMTAEDLP